MDVVNETGSVQKQRANTTVSPSPQFLSWTNRNGTHYANTGDNCCCLMISHDLTLICAATGTKVRIGHMNTNISSSLGCIPAGQQRMRIAHVSGALTRPNPLSSASSPHSPSSSDAPNSSGAWRTPVSPPALPTCFSFSSSPQHSLVHHASFDLPSSSTFESTLPIGSSPSLGRQNRISRSVTNLELKKNLKKSCFVQDRADNGDDTHDDGIDISQAIGIEDESVAESAEDADFGEKQESHAPQSETEECVAVTSNSRKRTICKTDKVTSMSRVLAESLEKQDDFLSPDSVIEKQDGSATSSSRKRVIQKTEGVPSMSRALTRALHSSAASSDALIGIYREGSRDRSDKDTDHDKLDINGNPVCREQEVEGKESAQTPSRSSSSGGARLIEKSGRRESAAMSTPSPGKRGLRIKVRTKSFADDDEVECHPQHESSSNSSSVSSSACSSIATTPSSMDGPSPVAPRPAHLSAMRLSPVPEYATADVNKVSSASATSNTKHSSSTLPSTTAASEHLSEPQDSETIRVKRKGKELISQKSSSELLTTPSRQSKKSAGQNSAKQS